MVDELLDRGAAKVYATARSPYTDSDGRVVPRVFDVTDDDSVAAVARAAPDVSIVVNNAGITTVVAPDGSGGATGRAHTALILRAVPKQARNRPQTTALRCERRRRKSLQIGPVEPISVSPGKALNPLTMEVLYQLS